MATLSEQIRDDLKAGLSDAFTLTMPNISAVMPFDDATPLQTADGRYQALPWTVGAKHTGSFMGVDPTGQDITITGITIVDTTSPAGHPQLMRIVDWSHVLAQLGVGINGRAVVMA